MGCRRQGTMDKKDDRHRVHARSLSQYIAAAELAIHRVFHPDRSPSNKSTKTVSLMKN